MSDITNTVPIYMYTNYNLQYSTPGYDQNQYIPEYTAINMEPDVEPNMEPVAEPANKISNANWVIAFITLFIGAGLLILFFYFTQPTTLAPITITH